MYTEHFGFREHPFRITPDPRFFYPNPGHQEAYASLVYGVTQRRGFVVLTGEVGTGKTTLLRRLMRESADSTRFAFVYNTTWTFDEVLDAVCLDFGLGTRLGARQFDKIQALNDFLLTQFTQDKTAALLIDEAHNLSVEVIENLRLLSNLETGSEKLLQIVLVGQSELEEKLRQPSLRSLRDRVAIWGRLDRLKERDVGSFILHRLQTAGYKGHELFTSEAIDRIATYSQGSPRRINIICDNALLTAYGAYQTQVSNQIIEEVARDLALCDRNASANQGVDAAPAPAETSTKMTRPLARINSDPDIDASRVERHEAVLKQGHDSVDEKIVQVWPRRRTPVRIAALATLLLCFLGFLFLRLSGKDAEGMTVTTTNLGNLLREWLYPPRQHEEAKQLVERPLLLEKYEKSVSLASEKKEDSLESFPQLRVQQSNSSPSALAATGRLDIKDNAAIARPPTTTSQLQVSASINHNDHSGQLVTVPRGATILDLVSQIYGKRHLLALGLVKEFNPHLDDLDSISAGERLWMPSLTRTILLRQQAEGLSQLIVASFRKHREAKRYVRTISRKGYHAAIIPLRVSATIQLYRIVIKDLQATADIEQAWQFVQGRSSFAHTHIVEEENTRTRTNTLN